MAQRLFRVLDGKLREIEDRMASGDAPQSAADAERDMRSLASLAQLYAKLVALDEKANGKGKADKGGAKGTGDDADTFRRELARRLEHLNRAREG
jgi:hypothetical protein